MQFWQLHANHSNKTKNVVITDQDRYVYGKITTVIWCCIAELGGGYSTGKWSEQENEDVDLLRYHSPQLPAGVSQEAIFSQLSAIFIALFFCKGEEFKNYISEIYNSGLCKCTVDRARLIDLQVA